MVSVRTSIEDAAVRGALDALGHAGEHLRPAFEDIGESLVASTQGRFERGVAPDGTPWLPSLRAKEQSGQTLVDTGRLKSSVTHQADDAGVTVGTNVAYAAIHQFGGQITRHAHSRQIYKRIDGRTGELGTRFVKRNRSNFAQWVEVPEYTIDMPARPFLGLSADDERSVLEILGDHILERWAQGAAAGAAGAPAGVTP